MKLTKPIYFYPEKPKLLSVDQPLFYQLSENPSWIAEKKYNEIRIVMAVCDGTFEIWNRHHEKLDYRPEPALMKALFEQLFEIAPPGLCILDGGLRHNKVPGIKHKIMIYDVMAWGGKLLVDKPFWYRRGLLKLPTGGDPLGQPEQYPNEFANLFRSVTRDPEIEGLVIKNLNGKPAPGRTSAVSSSWMWKVRRPSGRYAF